MRALRLGASILVSVSTLSVASAEARATYSILAIDPETKTVGGAVASCVPLDVVLRVYGAVPGRGGVMTQSYLFDPAHPDSLAMLAAGASPSAVVESLTDPAYDADFGLRQYAVVDVEGAHASFTGPDALAYAGHHATAIDGFVVLVQGNILTGDDVLARALDGFAAEACDLGGRLMAALEAAGVEGGGDARCVEDGVPAASAAIEVDPPEVAGGSFLSLSIESPRVPPSTDPVRALRERFDAWRSEHPCPEPSAVVAPPAAATPIADEGDGGCHASPCRSSRGGWIALVMLAAFVARRLVERNRRDHRAARFRLGLQGVASLQGRRSARAPVGP